RSRPSLGRDDGVADADLAVAEDVRIEAAAVQEPFDDPGLRHRLQVRARLAQLDAAALDVADAEGLADERIHVHATRDDVAPRLARLDRDPVLPIHRLDRLGRDER